MSKDTEIKKELKKLREIFKDIPESKRDLTERLMQNAAFMAATLSELQTIINTDGPVITITNGNGFETTQEHPAQKSYTQMVAKYSSIIKQLSDLLPDTKASTISKAGDSLLNFIKEGK